ncbi:MAG: sigma-70 family RNA polymerase sigma factor [Burkholderiales bacterium]|nr:sigma-70 family RNA polymerase sigma factor [Burkholderiales bacterium]
MIKLVGGDDASRDTGAGDDARDLDLVQRIAARERLALEELYHHYHRRLARFLTRVTFRYELAEEIINDTLWIVWQRAGDFRGASRVSTWIVGIAYRRALATMRHASVRPSLAGTYDPEDSDDPVAGIELRDLLDQALATLPPEQRLVLELTHYLGHSCEEIADIVACPVNTVKTRMFHARRKLRDLLPKLSVRN